MYGVSKHVRIEADEFGFYNVFVKQVHHSFIRWAAVEAAEYNWLGRPTDFRFVDPGRARTYDLKTAKRLAKMAAKSVRLVPSGVGQEVAIMGR